MNIQVMTGSSSVWFGLLPFLIPDRVHKTEHHSIRHHCFHYPHSAVKASYSIRIRSAICSIFSSSC